MSTVNSNTLHILHVVPSYLPATVYGGPLHSIHGLCKALVHLGHEVSVFTTNMNGDRDMDVPLQTPVDLDGVRVTYFPCSRLRRLGWSPPMGRALARDVPRMTVLHVHSVFQWPTYAASRAAWQAGVPYVLAPRGALVPELIRGKSYLIKSTWLRLVDRSTLACASRLHTTSEGEYQSACRLGVCLPPVCIVPNGIDLPDSRELPTSDAELAATMAQGPYCLFLGRLSWEKGLDRLLSAMAGTGLRLLIAGTGPNDYRAVLEGIILSHRLTRQITFAGQVTGADKWALLRGASFLVLPSYSENFGNVVIEALGVGCPTVVTEEVGAAEVVRRANAGFVTKGDPAALRHAMLRMDADPERRREMGVAGEAYVREHLSWGSVAEAMTRCYQSIVTTPHKG